MFQMFSKARAQNYLRSFLGEGEFRARSPERDAETDRVRLEAILRSIDDALTNATAEQTGLAQRVENVLARASVTVGNGNDEYLTRERLDSDHLDLFEKEIVNGQRRLSELAVSIRHFGSLKAELLSKFPDFEQDSPAYDRKSRPS